MTTSLRTLRESKNWSRAELARRAGLNAATVGQIEAGRLRPYPSQTLKLATALGLSLQDTEQVLQASAPNHRGPGEMLTLGS